jgi:hypothetical protein
VGSTSSNSSPRIIKLAAVSLALSIASLLAYASIIESAPTILFLVSTGGAVAAGIVSLLLALVARKESGQKEVGLRDRLLVTVSVLVAIGYVVCLSIVVFNIIVRGRF